MRQLTKIIEYKMWHKIIDGRRIPGPSSMIAQRLSNAGIILLPLLQITRR